MFRIEEAGEGVTRFVMDDGKVNAIGPAFVESFLPAWEKATASGNAIVLAGNAKAFGAGLDLRTLPTLDAAGLYAFFDSFIACLRAILAYERPVIAAVDGPALAGGAILALAADFRIVTPRARIGVIEVPVGVPFPAPVLELVRHALPAHEHAPAILAGMVREGADAVSSGWGHILVDSDALADTAAQYAGMLAASPRAIYADAKARLRAPVLANVDDFVANAMDAYIAIVSKRETMDEIVRAFARQRGKS